ncbi:8-oxo-dGTP diphosphatase [Veillonella agrestimuris]|uniref:8-oxo-dGTP diphosphatase n=1 Tax=Veillonella agrestimuris TaxID=2941340 RepID=UPI002041A10C|nr:8-oxo-dGTP diphosphatase [Veillonella agrestimuris]
MKPTTLVFPIDEQNRILLGRKKRGFGMDKYNGFGGKIQNNETFRQCAVRELYEESGIRVNPEDLECVALFDFRFPYDESLTHISYVYTVRVTGTEPIESDEMEPHWFTFTDVPYESMWAGDRRWLPMILEGRKLKGPIEFGPDNSDVTDMKLTDVHEVMESELLARIDLYLMDGNE